MYMYVVFEIWRLVWPGVSPGKLCGAVWSEVLLIYSIVAHTDVLSMIRVTNKRRNTCMYRGLSVFKATHETLNMWPCIAGGLTV